MQEVGLLTSDRSPGRQVDRRSTHLQSTQRSNTNSPSHQSTEQSQTSKAVDKRNHLNPGKIHTRHACMQSIRAPCSNWAFFMPTKHHTHRLRTPFTPSVARHMAAAVQSAGHRCMHSSPPIPIQSAEKPNKKKHHGPNASKQMIDRINQSINPRLMGRNTVCLDRSIDPFIDCPVPPNRLLHPVRTHHRNKHIPAIISL